jgi:glycosyltransferase involved in cell wall biosynthesis
MHLPRISIGMPVYNGERTVAAAIESILHQSWSDWELLISDNCSTDATESICRSYMVGDKRIRYLRQPKNLGAAANFRKVLDESRGEFFMWAAADDRRSDDFVEANIMFLMANPGYVASCSPVRLDIERFDHRYVGDEPVTGSRAQRILAVLPAHANGRFYSIFRREALLDCDLIDRHFLGADWAVMVHLAAKGPLHRVSHGWTLLGAAGASRNGNLYRSARSTWLDFLMPFRVLSLFAWQQSIGFTPAQKVSLAFKLAHLNAFGFVAQAVEALQRLHR